MSDLPAIEFDLSPEGAAPPALIRDMAAARRIDISGIFAPGSGYACEGAEAMRRVQGAIASVVTRPEDHARLLRAVIEECAANQAIHCEILMRPDWCGGGDPSAWADFLAAGAEVAGEARAAGVSLTALAVAARETGPDRGRRAARCAAETAGDYLTGFGLYGPEAAGPAGDHAWAFDCAREAGLGLAVEVGVTGSPKDIRDTITALRPDRLSGALRLAEDPALVEDLAERGLAAVLFPAADVAFGRVADWRAHPVEALVHRGARIAIATGAPAFLGNSPARDRDRLHAAFDFDEGVFAALAETALDAAFCGTDTRDRLRNRLRAGR